MLASFLLCTSCTILIIIIIIGLVERQKEAASYGRSKQVSGNTDVVILWTLKRHFTVSTEILYGKFLDTVLYQRNWSTSQNVSTRPQ